MQSSNDLSSPKNISLTSKDWPDITLATKQDKRFQELCKVARKDGLDALYKKLEKINLGTDFHLSADDLYYLILLAEEQPKTYQQPSCLKTERLLSVEQSAKQVIEKSTHQFVKEQDGSGMEFVLNKRFRSWDDSIENQPEITFMPKSIQGLKNLVTWAELNGKRLRASGYRHSSSDIYSEDNQVLVSMIDLDTAIYLPAIYPNLNPQNDLQGIQLIGTAYEKQAKQKIKCRIGAATCNYHFQDWVHDPHRGNREWAMPLNVIMTEITFGGSNAPICHGAGITNKTLSDLVTEIEFVNVQGKLQIVNDPQQIKAASGCFGLLGLVTSLTIELDKMEYANFKTVEKKLLTLTIPPPADHELSLAVKKNMNSENRKTLTKTGKLKQAFAEFINDCENNYYAEWFWFPLQDKCWINCWQSNGDKQRAVRYPGEVRTEVQRAESYVAYLADSLIGDSQAVAKLQTKLMGNIAMYLLPDKPQIVCTLEDALHFRQGIQNVKVRMMEIEIPVPDSSSDSTQADWSICQKAWWAVIESVYSDENMKYFPMRTTLEMRVMGGSDVLMAPQYNNKRTCSIEILTPVSVDEKKWRKFLQEILDKWAMLKDNQGHYLNIRPHWAKRFDGLIINRALDWQYEWDATLKHELQDYIGHDQTKLISIPIRVYLKQIACRQQITAFLQQMEKICEAGGYQLADIRKRFSNPFLDELFSLSPTVNNTLQDVPISTPLVANSFFSADDNNQAEILADITRLPAFQKLLSYTEKLFKEVNSSVVHKKSTQSKANDLQSLLDTLQRQSMKEAMRTIETHLPYFHHARGFTSRLFGLETTSQKLLMGLMAEIEQLSSQLIY